MTSKMPKAPAAVLKQLATARTNWNRRFGKQVKMTGWTYHGTIQDRVHAKEIETEMTDPIKVWFPSWNDSTPGPIKFLRIKDDPTVTRALIAKWKKLVRSHIQVGEHVFRISWLRGGKKVSSVCVTNGQSVVYDSILSNTVITDHHSRCFDYHIGWIWQTNFADMTRGKIWADCIPNCKPDGSLLICDQNCGGDMTLGTAKCVPISCKRIPGSDCCNLAYSWGWGTPLITVKVTLKGKFGSVTVSGILGSSGSGSGSCTCCCPGVTKTATGVGGKTAVRPPAAGPLFPPQDDKGKCELRITEAGELYCESTGCAGKCALFSVPKDDPGAKPVMNVSPSQKKTALRPDPDRYYFCRCLAPQLKNDEDGDEGEDCEFQQVLNLVCKGPKNGQINVNYTITAGGEVVNEGEEYTNLDEKGKSTDRFDLSDICVPGGCDDGFSYEAKFHFSVLDEDENEVCSGDKTVDHYFTNCEGPVTLDFDIGCGKKASIDGFLELTDFECGECDDEEEEGGS